MQFLKRLFTTYQVTSEKFSPAPSLSGSVIMLTDSSEGFSEDEGKEKKKWYISESTRNLLSVKEKVKLNICDSSPGVSSNESKEKDVLNLSDVSQGLSSDERKRTKEKDKLYLSDCSLGASGKFKEPKRLKEPKSIKDSTIVKEPTIVKAEKIAMEPKKVNESKTGKEMKKVKEPKKVTAPKKAEASKIVEKAKEPEEITDSQKLKEIKKHIDRRETVKRIGKDIREFQEKVLQCIGSKEEDEKFKQPEDTDVDEYKETPGTQGFCDSILECLCCVLQITLRILSRIGKSTENAMNVFATACYNCASLCQQLVHVMPICCIACYYKNKCLRTCGIFNSIQTVIISLAFTAIIFFIIKITILGSLMLMIGYENTSEFEEMINNATDPAARQGDIDSFDLWDLPQEIPTPADFADWDTASDKQEEDDSTTETETKHEETLSEVFSTSADYEDVVVEYDSTQSNLHLADIPVYDSTYYDRISNKKVVNARHKTVIESLIMDGKEMHDLRSNKIQHWKSLANDDNSTSSEKQNLLARLQAILRNKPRNKEKKSVDADRTAFVSWNRLFSTGGSILFKTMSGQSKKVTFFEPMFRKNVLTENLRHLGGVSVPAAERYFRTRWNLPSKTHSETETTVASTVMNPVLVAPSLHGFGDFR